MKKLFIVIFAGLITGLVITKFNPNDNVAKNESQTPQATANSSITLPVDLNNKNVLFAGITYTFGGTVDTIEASGTNYKIELQNSIPSMPEIITNERTVIVRRENDSEVPAEFSDISKGTPVSVAMLYDIKNESWRVNRIFIIVRPSFEPQQQ